MILSKVQEQNFITVGELVQMFHASLATIRRDLNIPCKQRLLEWCHGGAEIPRGTIMEIDYNVKKEYQWEEEQKIAQKAVELTSENDIIYLDSDATTGEIAKLLRENSKYLLVVTNELNIAAILTDSDVNLTILGGTVYKETKSVIGHAGEEFLKQFRFSKAFLETSSMNYNFEVLSPTPDKTYLKQTVMGLASQVYLVVNSSKFYSQAAYPIGYFNKFTGVTTDKRFNEEEWEKIRELSINMIEV